MTKILLIILGLLALLASATACAGQSAEVTACVDRVAARASGSGGANVAEIAHEVERLRSLRFKRVPKPRFVDQAEMIRLLRKQLKTPTQQVEGAQRGLRLLGEIGPQTDLEQLTRNDLAADVAGYYDDRTHALVVLSGKKLGGFERITLSHELDHALTDQRLGLPHGGGKLGTARNDERDVAAAALAEGDATLIMEAFASADMAPADALDALSAATGGSSNLPHYVEASEEFPYFEGEAFVCHLLRRGGWPAVARAYARPPQTSAEIMFPARYLAHERPVVPAPAESPGPAWKRLDDSTIGAADLLWLFEAPGNRTSRALTVPRRRAAAWAGGEAVVWSRGARSALAMTLVERHGARPRLCASMQAWAKAAGKPAGAVACSGRIVRVTLRS
jgi:hypothetical protein